MLEAPPEIKGILHVTDGVVRQERQPYQKLHGGAAAEDRRYRSGMSFFGRE
jgi:hypothetical protein